GGSERRPRAVRSWFGQQGRASASVRVIRRSSFFVPFVYFVDGPRNTRKARKNRHRRKVQRRKQSRWTRDRFGSLRVLAPLRETFSFVSALVAARGAKKWPACPLRIIARFLTVSAHSIT